ncbi:hypothetical protein AAF712_001821 [Marasmius tenuissimus]|uniref:Uncharacterized protein n=1 Tax=Marasmius tenuissimus TaxID=585030 RepID=A0ABR3ACL3_9AGAR|nr:hypothetical protein PM082_008039 [Marasmius tenuissimus]
MVDPDVLQKASELEVFGPDGERVKFGTLFANRKTVVVFTRHFFCGSCQAYVRQLSAVPVETLDRAGVEVVIIGCGDWQAIAHYATSTGFLGKMYAEPTRELYHALGMDIETLATTPTNQEKRSYIVGSAPKRVLTSLWEGPLKNPSLIGKQGHFSQLGGDFVLGPGNQCSYAHIMQHTEDHVEVAELMNQAGVKY